jgi:molybdenum cofactor cytidylyltransferase
MSVVSEVIVLAAGRSSRMGEPKGLVPVHGRPWVLAQIDAIERAGGRVVLVLGADRDRYRQALPDLGQRARVVFNDDPDRGSFSSLQCGLAAIAPDAPVFVLPVDVPAASPEVWSALREALAGNGGPGGADAAVPEYDGRGGHPVLLASSTVASLKIRPATTRLDAELAALPRVVRVPVKDPAIRLNLNAPQDWGKLDTGP